MVFGSALPVITASFDIDHEIKQFIPYTIVGEEGRLAKSRTFALERAPADNSYTTSPWQEPTAFEYALARPRNNLTAALSLRQPLFSQGKTFINMKIARARQSQLVCKYEEARDGVKSETIKMFFRLLLEQQRVEINKKRCALAEETHRLTKANYTFGRARELDTLTSLLRLEQARIDARRAEGERRRASQTMIVQCGLVLPPEDFWVEGTFPEPVFFITLDEAIVQLGKGNHRIRLFRGDEKIQNGMLHLAMADLLPAVFCGATAARIGQFSHRDDPGWMRWGDDQRVFAGLSWELFSGITRQNTIRRLKIEREQLMLAQQKTIDELELETRTCFERVTATMERLTAIQTMIGIASKSYTIARKAFEVGSCTQFDLQNAEMELNRTNLLYNETLYDFHCKVTDFKFLIGRL